MRFTFLALNLLALVAHAGEKSAPAKAVFVVAGLECGSCVYMVQHQLSQTPGIVEVEVLFLSFDVSVRCRREFGGGDADPKFLDLIPTPSVWDEYCAAFAPETL